jgi:hypothetical protein
MYPEHEGAGRRGLRNYVRAVAGALGLSGETFTIQDESPAEVYLAIDGRLPDHPGRDVALIWDELRGWALVTESGQAGDLPVVSRFGDDVVPDPGAVARFVRAATRGRRLVLARPNTAADVGERLAAYAAPEDLQSSSVLYRQDEASRHPAQRR